MRKNHTPTAVSFKLQFIESIAIEEAVETGDEATDAELRTDPSLMSFARRSR
jgi:hypothetical protein